MTGNGVAGAVQSELGLVASRVIVLVGTPVGLGLLSWLLVGMSDLKADFARVNEKFIAIDSTFAERNNRITGVEQELLGPNRYRRQDAERDFYQRDQRLNDHEARIRLMERRPGNP